MAWYVARRLALSGATLLAVTALVYLCLRMLPGRPTWGEDPDWSPQLEAWLAAAHVDDPIPVGYARWLADLVRLDLGVSIAVQPGRPVASLIAAALPFTVQLGILSLAAGLALSLPLGIAVAWRPDSPAARAGTTVLYGLHALPVFFLAATLQQMAVRLGFPSLYLPGGGRPHGADDLIAGASVWILATAAVTLGSLAFLVRFCRSSLLEAVASPFFRAARARGAGEGRALCRHALAHTAVPLLSLLGLTLPGVLSGSVLVEQIFGLPGVGRLFIRAATRRDYPVVMALAVLTAGATIAAHLVCDLLYRRADPRMAGGDAQDWR